MPRAHVELEGIERCLPVSRASVPSMRPMIGMTLNASAQSLGRLRCFGFAQGSETREMTDRMIDAGCKGLAMTGCGKCREERAALAAG